MLSNGGARLSIATNFGCAKRCKSCSWKKYSFKDVDEPTDWETIECLIAGLKRDFVAIGGGSDPLYRLRDYANWWWTLMAICGEYGKKISVHTATVDIPWGWARHFDRITLHLDPTVPLPESRIRTMARWTELRLAILPSQGPTEIFAARMADLARESSIAVRPQATPTVETIIVVPGSIVSIGSGMRGGSRKLP